LIEDLLRGRSVGEKRKAKFNKQLIMIRPSEREEQTSVFHN
jgi:hypothetical protein